MCVDFDLLSMICYYRTLQFKLYHIVGSSVTYLLLCMIVSIQAAEWVSEKFNPNTYDNIYVT